MNENILSPESLASTSPRRGNNNTLMGAVQRLASNVAVMENAVMVPSRLMGLSSEEVKNVVVKDDTPEISIDHGTDLYMYFNMLKSLKSELVRGSSPFRPSPNFSSTSSTISTASSGSSTSSVVDSEDEGDGEERNMETTQTIELFRMHLKGLVDIMNRLSDSSQMITKTYQKSFVDEETTTTTGSR